MATSDPLAPYYWLNADDGNACPLGEIFTVAFFRGLDPSEVVRRFSRGADQGRESDFDGIMRQASESCSTPSEGLAVGVWQAGEWSVAIEPFGWMATLPDVLAELSRDCEVVAITHHAYAEDCFMYAIDGTLVTGYKPLSCPHIRFGSEPDRLYEFMRELGMPLDMEEEEHEWDWDDDDDDYFAALPRAFALTAQLTQVRFTPEMLDRAMLVGPVAFKWSAGGRGDE
ncbi:DUF6461 domain-containing protein [Nocardia sp. NPDC051832]|uniref:DUF6461 domain-containing protein n=1 Tax=Nocardia sp. NPDC051832 TaxID=3155673 RepID=UPI00342A90C6